MKEKFLEDEAVKLLPLTSDVVFKEVFGQEESKPILLVFLNDVLGFDIKSPDQLTILNPAFNPDYADDKLCILDVRVQLSNRVSVDIEIQVINQKNIEPRAVYYVSQLCADQLRVGEGYIKLAPVFGLNLLCFDLYDDKRYYRKYVLKDKETNAEYPNYFEIDFFELRKAARILKKNTGEMQNLAGIDMIHDLHCRYMMRWGS